MKTTTFPFLLLAATTLACSSRSAPTSPEPSPSETAERVTSDITGHEWRLLGFVIADALLDSSIGVVTLSLNADGSLGGRGGCNGYGGSWTRSDTDNLAIGDIISTLMACAEPEGVMQQEARYFDTLAQVTDAERIDDQLKLTFSDTGDHMVFERIVPEQVPPEPYTQIWWQLDSFETVNGDAVTIDAALPGATLFFDDNGSAHGSTGCNRWVGDWNDGGEHLRLDGIGATKMACAEPKGIMAQEARFLDALSRVARIVSITGEITLYTDGSGSDGVVGLRFVPHTDGDIRAIRGGTSFGECLGYCWEELHVDGGTIRLRNGGWDSATPERAADEAYDQSRWNILVSMADLDAFFALDEIIGCPDCADGGAEWIEIETTAGARRITYEYGNAPAPIVNLARALQDLRGLLRDHFVVPTVVLE